ncbi:MAG: L-serine ammonia-lyase [Acidobacteriaceae bacterium]|jgi:L-serine dehydratase|nr:L-serine ammonia-lyase [Acidobacteriaceae bacterium]
MNTSLFELFKIGIGPSSSHTVGPMRAAHAFLQKLQEAQQLAITARITSDLYGSLALTGIGHATDHAILFGLSGEMPDTIEPAAMERILQQWRADETITLPDGRRLPFRNEQELVFHRDQMYPQADTPSHPNGMRFTAFDDAGNRIAETIIFSVGGGFIRTSEEFAAQSAPERTVPYPFHNAAELLAVADEHGLTVAEMIFANECALLQQQQPGKMQATIEKEVRQRILHLWQTMTESAERGMATEGILPGGLKVRRRAPHLAARLRLGKATDPLAPLDWVTVYAMAVNEENAAGGRVVTAPTNGAAGIIPAVGLYYLHFTGTTADEEGILRYLLTAAAIGVLYKENASISGAEVGCQGEVGVACSMAAGGLAAALQGSNQQVEHSAEIGMEHNLGMTCDPIGGLVQIPCIERNAMGAIKAVNASRLAMSEEGEHKVSLDQVIKTMYETGLDMQSRYKETSLAGLALNKIQC